jgi:hypothetical protein
MSLVRSASRGLIQRLIDAASEAVDVVGHRLSAAADPRGRLLRKRKWALRLGLFFGFSSVLWILVTALLASWSTPVWALLITGLVAAGAAFPAALCFLRYRWLRGQPLPPRRAAASHRLPPHGSAARPAMYALGAAERGLVSLIAVLDRGEMVPPAEIAELTAAAERSASTMASTAAQVVAMERAAAATPQSRAQLAPTINAYTAQLGAGVRQYNEMVTAAAQLVSSANAAGAAAAPIAQQRYRNELSDATDRLLGWSQAFEELGQLRHA